MESRDSAGIPALGVVPAYPSPTAPEGLGPFALIHGEPLIVVASWSLEEARIELFDFTASWVQIVGTGRALVIHDPLCPLTPASFLAQTTAACVRADRAVVGFRPVTDTVKRVTQADGEIVVHETLDRSRLRQVTSPIALPARVVASFDVWPPLDDFAALAARLPDPLWIEAPATSRRIVGADDLAVLEAATAPR